MTIAILAAGSSTRFGTPKQIAPFRGTTLIAHAVDTAASAGGDRILVVLGCNSEQIAANVPPEAEIVENEEWEEGMASSIRAAVLATIDDVLVVTLCDQPLITSHHLRQLAKRGSRQQIVATRYADVIGVPCAFRRDVFPLLLALEGEEGARSFIRSIHAEAQTAPFEAAHVDVDTIEDLQRLREWE